MRRPSSPERACGTAFRRAASDRRQPPRRASRPAGKRHPRPPSFYPQARNARKRLARGYGYWILGQVLTFNFLEAASPEVVKRPASFAKTPVVGATSAGDVIQAILDTDPQGPSHDAPPLPPQ